MLIRFPFGAGYFAWTTCRRAPNLVEISWGRRDHVPLGEVEFRRNLSIGWAWVPEIVWQPLGGCPGANDYCSAAWTGRACTAIAIIWRCSFNWSSTPT